MYQISEKFKSVQGEGLYAGTPMAFIRFVGCSVGKRVCQHCDTDFEQMHNWRGGGQFSAEDLQQWSIPYKHICWTGGEPFDQPDFFEAVDAWDGTPVIHHVETSGTKPYEATEFKRLYGWNSWLCVSPKPGFSEEAIAAADEVKVIVPGLGNITSAAIDERIRKLKGEGYQCGPGEFEDHAKAYRWPTLQDALRWAYNDKLVFVQPRNSKFDVDQNNLRIVQDIVAAHPQLRLSTQLHKILKVQ